MKLIYLMFGGRCCFGIGYDTHLILLLGYASTLVTIYYIAIKSIPKLASFFPKLGACQEEGLASSRSCVFQLAH